MITCETENNKVSFVKLLTFFIDFTYDIYIIKRNSCNFLPEYSFNIVTLSLFLLLRINHLSTRPATSQHRTLPEARQKPPANTSLWEHHITTQRRIPLVFIMLMRLPSELKLELEPPLKWIGWETESSRRLRILS